MIVDSYGGDAAAIWTSAEDGNQLLANVKAIPGFGDQKARIFVALLGKQFGIRPSGWKKVSAPYGESGSFRSVADIDSPEAWSRCASSSKRQGQGQGQSRLTARPAERRCGVTGRWCLEDRRLYLCTPDRPDLERFVELHRAAGSTSFSSAKSTLPIGCWSSGPALVQRVCADHGVPFILNDRPDLAAAIGADGVHVGQDDMSPHRGPSG